MQHIKSKVLGIALGALLAASPVLTQNATAQGSQTMIEKSNIQLASDRMTPEALWAMGRIGAYAASPDGTQVVYQVSYYSVAENRSHTMLYIQPVASQAGKKSNTKQKGKKQAAEVVEDFFVQPQATCLTTDAKSEAAPAWIEGGSRIAFLREDQLWSMRPDGTDRRQLSQDKTGIDEFKFSPDGKRILLTKTLPFHESIKERPADLPKATGRLVTDLNFRHWDHYVEEFSHPFVADVKADGTITEGRDILEGEPYECPMAPFGGIEQLDWSRDSKQIAYTCRKKTGVDYATSTDSDIYLYDIATGKTHNLCKPEGYVAPKTDPTKSLRDQKVNHQEGDMHVGYDTNPQFSPDGTRLAWQSMARDGYESDRNRLCILDLATGQQTYVTESFDSNVDDYCWAQDSRSIYFLGVWHGTEMVYEADLQGGVRQLTDGWYDYAGLQPIAKGQLLVKRHNFMRPDDLYTLTISKKEKQSQTVRITGENDHILSQLAEPSMDQRWVKTTDGKEELVWIIRPPHFDPNKKYPTLLFCEGGPQSPVSQFWSYRWNFRIMASQGYVIVAPNRRGLPGFGSEWNEAVSQDWTGQCMRDYLSAIDDAAENLPYVDRDRMGAVGASFGGFSVFYLAGHHEGRFKTFISHCGAFNLESMYTDTEEAFFSNWEYDDAYWNKDRTAAAARTYENSPHRFVDRWDTPILIVQGEKDYRIPLTQGIGAFNAAKMRGLEAELLIFPDENHWVLKPQNGVLWQRTFFGWLDRWLKK